MSLNPNIVKQLQRRIGLPAEKCDGLFGEETLDATLKAVVRYVPTALATTVETMGNAIGADGNHDDPWPTPPGIDFFFQKATQGTRVTDPTLAHRLATATVPIGLYHFTSGENAEDQAKHFIATAKAAGFDVKKHAVVIDFEESARPDIVGNDMTAEQAETWIHLVESELGCKVIVYGSDMLVEALENGHFVNQPLWPAHYRTTAPHGRTWTFWQYTESGSPYSDMNRYNGTVEQLHALWPNFPA